MTINEQIRQALEKYLEANNMTASGFALKINVNRSSILRFLDGKFTAGGKLLDMMAKEMGGTIKFIK